MDYEKKLALAKEALDSGSYDKETIEYIFPELKESEDERIRKTLIDYFNTCHGDYYGELKRKDILAWLEKQGEKKSILDFKAKDWYVSKVDGKIHNIYHSVNKVEPKFHKGEWVTNGDYTWKIVEVKPLDYILQSQDGNVVDDTISHVDEQFHSFTIEDAKDGDVLHSPTHNLIWIHKDIQHYHACVNMNYVKENFFTDGFIVTPTDVCPATKDEQTILFARMKEVEYEWDSEKKELKKINSYCQENCKGFQEIGKCFTDGECKAKREVEQKPTDEEMEEILHTEYEKGRADAIAEMQKSAEVRTTGYWNVQDIEQKPAWNEDDEEFLRRAINTTKDNYPMTAKWLKSLKDRVQPKQEWNEEDESYLNTTIAYLKDAKEFKKSAENCINWLKSLKDRVQPILRRRHTIFDEII